MLNQLVCFAGSVSVQAVHSDFYIFVSAIISSASPFACQLSPESWPTTGLSGKSLIIAVMGRWVSAVMFGI